jgi:uncharacterized protein (TIGR02996 family)
MEIGDMDVEEFQQMWRREKRTWDRLSQQKRNKEAAGRELTEEEMSNWSRARAGFAAAEQLWDQAYAAGVVIVVGGDDDDDENLAALHEHVVAAPHDDAPRLAYADAVEAADPERAEFIRLEIVLAQRRRDGWGVDDESTDLYLRQFALRSARGAALPSATARLTVSPVCCDSLSIAGCMDATKSKLRSARVPSRMTSRPSR